jgi:cell division protein FtsW
MLRLPVSWTGRDFGQRVDPWITGACMVLLTVGVAVVYSGSAVRAAEAQGSPTFFFARHATAVALGLVLLAAVVRVSLETWYALAYPLLGLTFLLLLLTVASPLGEEVNGARRWLDLKLLRIQPSELAKLVVVLYLAKSLAKKRERVTTFSAGFLPHVIVVSALVLLILKQPDLGTSAVIYGTLAVMLFVAGTRTAYLGLAIALAVPVLVYYVRSHQHALERITAFLAPETDVHGKGFQVYQSLVAFGSGGPLGMGLGEGSQKLFFLPEPHTDFVFATIGQELGFAGVSVVLLAFCVLVGRSLWVATRLPAPFAMFLTFGLAAWLGMQAAVNMGVAVALLPTKGLTLPLVSYGRSSMLVSLLGVGVLLRASAEAAATGVSGSEEARRC